MSASSPKPDPHHRQARRGPSPSCSTYSKESGECGHELLLPDDRKFCTDTRKPTEVAITMPGRQEGARFHLRHAHAQGHALRSRVASRSRSRLALLALAGPVTACGIPPPFPLARQSAPCTLRFRYPAAWSPGPQRVLTMRR